MASDKTDRKPTLTRITVIGPERGRRRAGFAFGREPAAIEVSDEQLAAIKADPQLAVTEGWPVQASGIKEA